MKKYIHIIFIYLLFTASYTAAAQGYYPIPDPNLRARLIDSFPTYMNDKGELDTQAVKGVSKDLILDNLGITNADGIQFFQSVGIVKLRSNKLTSIPQLSYMKGVRRVYLNANQLTSIPDLSALYQLQDLSVINNKITSLSGINLENRSTLEALACSGNQITTLPDLSQLTSLKTLSVDHNPISILPSLPLTSLLQLDIGNTNIHSVPSLSALTSLQKFNCDNTDMTDISGLENNTTLIKLSAENCLLTSLPNFGNKLNLTSATIQNNHLTFEDLIPLTYLTTPSFSVFFYSPQKEVSIPLYATTRETNNFTYQVSIDPLLTTNQYVWSKNGTQLLPAKTTGNYNFTPAFMSDSGTYYVQITNPALPLLILKSNRSTLTVRTCIEINKINMSILSSDCREGSLIDIAGTVIDGGTAPLTYTLQSTSPVRNIPGTTATQFDKIIPGTYILTVIDNKNCSAMKSFLLDKGVDCESVFSPNGDGIMDNYFIPDTGTIQIYNTSKKLIRTMNVPGAWDGTTNDGTIADAGYYVIIINGSGSIGVSLMR